MSDTLTPLLPLYSVRVSRQEVIGVPENTHANAALVAAAEQLGQCDGYMFSRLIRRPERSIAHGPYDGMAATLKADRLRHEFDEGGAH